MPEDDVNIRIKRDTWSELHSRKQPGDSFDAVIKRLLDKAEAYEESQEGNAMAARSD